MIPCALIRNAVEDWVKRQQGVTGEVHLGHQPREERLAEKGEVDVCGAPGIVMISPRIRARLDGHEAIAPFAVGEGAATTREIGVKRRTVIVNLVAIPSCRVALPDLN